MRIETLAQGFGECAWISQRSSGTLVVLHRVEMHIEKLALVMDGCSVVNDLAIATRALQATGEASRIAVLDLDVHQGDGTAGLLGGDESVLTISVHAASNFPARKVSRGVRVRELQVLSRWGSKATVTVSPQCPVSHGSR